MKHKGVSCLLETPASRGIDGFVSASTNKKVVVHRLHRAPVGVYIGATEDLGSGPLHVLRPGGTLHEIDLDEVKSVCFVRDPEGHAPFQEQRLFRSRPKTEGLWIQLEFRDDDLLQGVVPNNLLTVEPGGVTYTPPDPTANNQRIFAPRTALRAARVLGVIGGQAKSKGRRDGEQRQIGLFE